MKELRIKCPSCSIILDVRNSRNETVKRIVCPNCKAQLAVNFQDDIPATEAKPIGSLHYGEAVYPLAEGENVIGTKMPSSDAHIQIATGDSMLLPRHAAIRVVRLANGNCKCIVSPAEATAPVAVNGQALAAGDKIVLTAGDKIQLGNTTLVYQ